MSMNRRSFFALLAGLPFVGKAFAASPTVGPIPRDIRFNVDAEKITLIANTNGKTYQYHYPTTPLWVSEDRHSIFLQSALTCEMLISAFLTDLAIERGEISLDKSKRV